MPLTFDMPLKKLRFYRGRNPRPKDFDKFWDRSLKEMKAVDPDVKLVKSDFKAPGVECFDMFFTGVGNARIHAKLLRPVKVTRPGPAVLMFHGYSGHAGDWFDKLGFAACGFTVAALDCRGQAGRSEDPGGVTGNTLRGHLIRGLANDPEKLLFRQIFLDTAQLAGIVMDMPGVDRKRVGVTGGSQGGGLTLACAALEPGIKLAAPTFPFLCDYRRVWEMDQAKDAYGELQEFFRWFDPRHEKEDLWFTRLGYIDVQHLCPRIRAKVNMAIGLMDTVCPPSTQFAAYNKIRSIKTLELYPDFRHEGLPERSDNIFKFMSNL